MAKYLVTGGAGFIGSNLARELVKRKNEVIVFDNFSTGKIENLRDILNKIKIIKGDIRNLDTLKKATRGVDYVIHLAAIASVKKSIEEPIQTNRVNIDGTLNVLKSAKEAKVKKVIFASSCAVYGNLNNKKANEKIRPKPISPYGKAKLKGETFCKKFSKQGLKTVILRFFNVFGPNQDPKGEYSAVIPKFINLSLIGKDPVIYGDGKQSRDFIFVKDVIKSIILACKSNFEKGEVFNIGSGKSFNLLELIAFLKKLLKKEIYPIFKKERKGDIKNSYSDISKAKKYLRFYPSYSFEKGLKETIKFYKEKLK
ncbi:MAG: NAD-dependent epimerase/dehydratase family protein [Candidatus Nanoarchaeia archaeon]